MAASKFLIAWLWTSGHPHNANTFRPALQCSQTKIHYDSLEEEPLQGEDLANFLDEGKQVCVNMLKEALFEEVPAEHMTIVPAAQVDKTLTSYALN